MKAMILAAGRGERMRPLTDDLPKPLLAVAGKPLIVHQLERLVAAGVSSVVINHAHLGHLIEAALGDGRRYGASIEYSREALALDTAGGIANALALLGSGPFLLVSGDIYAEYDYARLPGVAAAMAHSDELAHLILIETEVPPPYDFTIDGNSGAVVRSGLPKLAFAGIGVFQPALFADIARGAKAALLPLLLEGIARRRVSGEVYSGPYANLTTPDDLAALDRRLSR